MRAAVLISSALVVATALVAQTPVGPVNKSTVTVHVSRLEFRDSPGVPADVEREITRSVTTRAYGPAYCAQIGEIVRDGLQRHGFFKAAVDGPKCEVVNKAGDSLSVDAAVVVYQGAQYRLKSIEFSGATAFTSDQMRPLLPLKDGEVFNIEKVRAGIRVLKDLYGTKGYINFTPIPDFTFDENLHLLTMKIDIDEGDAYSVGDLIIDGEESEPGAKQRLLKAWEKYKGSYQPDPIQQVLRDLHARPNLPLEKFVTIAQDNEKHVLTYRLTLGKPGARLSFAP